MQQQAVMRRRFSHTGGLLKRLCLLMMRVCIAAFTSALQLTLHARGSAQHSHICNALRVDQSIEAYN